MARATNGSKSAAEKSGRRFRIPLSLKFVTIQVLLAALLLLAACAVGLWWAYQETERSALATEQGKAETVARQIDAFVTELQSQLAWTTQPAWESAAPEQQRADFTRMLQQFPAITELVFIDSTGAEQLKVSRLAPDSIASGTDHASEPRFAETVKARTWYGPVYIRNGSDLATTIGMAHGDGAVSVAEVDLAFVSDLVNAAKPEDGDILVVDQTGRLIARPGKNPVVGDNDMSGIQQVATAIADTGNGTMSNAVADDGTPVFAAYVEVPRLGWRVLAQTSRIGALTPFIMLAIQSALVLGVGLLIAAITGGWMARRVTKPIKRLEAGVEQLGEGDLAQRVAFRRRDEIGALADQFNAMASRLQQSQKGLEARIDDRAQGQDIAQQQQTITADMLKTLSGTDYKLEHVLEALIGSSVRLAEANVGAVWLRAGKAFRLAAQLGHTADWVEKARQAPFTEGSETHAVAAAAAYSGQLVNIDDISRDLRFMGDYGERPANSDERAALAVPLKHEGAVEAVFVLSRADPLPFTERQVTVTQDFADQALIAIREMRLEEQIDARDKALQQSFDQQAAATDILRVISQSSSDIQPVLDSIVASAARLCDAPYCYLDLFDGRLLHFKAHHGLPPAAIDIIGTTFPMEPGRGSAAARAVGSGRVVEISDMLVDKDYKLDALSRLLETRSTAAVPLKKDGTPIGVITIEKTEAGRLPERQIELLKTFAEQAVIAIQNFRMFEEIQARNRDVTEALEQQTATADALKTISSSAFDLDAVLHTLVTSASHLCRSGMGYIYLRQGDMLQPRVQIGWSQEFQDHMKHLAVLPGRGSIAARVALSGTVEQIPDVLADPEYTNTEGQRLGGFRTLLGVPLLRDGIVNGVFVLARPVVSPFNEREIELVKTFSDQAVIAIENVRLFEQVQARTAELGESLQQQTATADVLKVISRSAFDLEVVFQALLESAARLCSADCGSISLRAGALYQVAATVGFSDEYRAYEAANPHPVGRGSLHGRAVLERRTIEVPDVLEDAEYQRPNAVALGHFRAVLAVPILREGQVLGVFALGRRTPGNYPARQVELVETFADQAAIAIENVRLFDEVQARTNDLQEALTFQKATSDVLEVIGRSASSPQPVFDAIVETAAELCRADIAVLRLLKDDSLHHVASSGPADSAIATYSRETPILPSDRSSVAGRVALERRTIQINDVTTDPEYTYLNSLDHAPVRTTVGVPLMQEGKLAGVIVLLRKTVDPFSERQIQLVQTFADQAVIALENARLFDEVQARTAEVTEALQQQTATGDVLRVIASSPSDIEPVLNAVVESAARLCDAYDAGVMFKDGNSLTTVAHHGPIPLDIKSWPIGRAWVSGRAVVDCAPVHVHDLSIEEEEFPEGRQMALRLGHRTILATPLMREGEAIGVLMIRRTEVRPFSEKQVQLLKTFADQAVIAIENARLFDEVQARTADVSEALRQQTATAEVLKAISRSAFDLQPILQTLVESAARLAGADMGAITLRDGDVLRFMAGTGEVADLHAYERSNPHKIGRGTFQGRAAIEGTTVHVPDVSQDVEYERPEAAIIGDFRAALSVPLKRNQETIGVFGMARRTAGPFTPRQIELVETFADQAVIAIENTRLFDEVQARTADVSEALRQQTATAEVLKVISRSAFDLQVVLDTLAESAARLCEADIVDFYRLGDEGFLWAASFSSDPNAERDHTMITRKPGRGSASGRVLLEHKTVHIPDFETDPEFTFGEVARKRGVRTILGVPLLREDALIGLLLVLRKVPSPFTARQIELAETFADQAVIAIENVRLFDEVQARTAELGEALEQQTATADVLKVINASAFDLQTVLDTLVESAVRLCRADKGCLERIIDGRFQYAALTGFPPSFEAYSNAHQTEPGRGSAAGRAVEERRAIQIEDVTLDTEYTHSQIAEVGGMRTVLAVPLLREGEVLGTFAMIRTEVRPFNAREIELVTTFADQAVIAMENVRLFDEVQARTADVSEALRQQTATADVLKVISRSAFDLQSVLQTLIDSAVRLCGAKMSGIFMRDGDVFRLAAGYDQTPEYRAYEEANPSPIIRQSWVGRTALDKTVIHIPDVSKDQEHGYPEFARLGGFAAVLCVPLLREGSVIGVFAMTRPEPGPFTANQIELVQTFADQAVIAIENVRLFEEVQARTADVSEALRQQTATADVLKVISRSAFDLPNVLNALVESAAKLCGANYGGIFLRYGDELRGRATISERLSDWAIDHPISIDRRWISGRVVVSGHIEHIADVEQDPEFNLPEFRKITDTRALMGVPMLREGNVEGVFFLGKPEPGAFTVRQSELVQTFADQAVIAIENVKLFEQVQARTAELSEALQQQTATADVLKVISRSAFDLDTVLQTLVETAARLCDTSPGLIFRRDGDVYRFASGQTLDPEFERLERGLEVRPGRGTVIGRALLEKRVVQVVDVWEDPEYEHQDIAKAGKLRSVLAVPLLRQGEPIGAFGFSRDRVEPFTERQIELVTTFADQAVIAIENVRLFDQVQARTQELAASLQELQTAQGRLLQTEKLASLGQLTAGIAHEIKNPLNFVSNFSLLSSELVDDIRMVLEGAVIDGGTRAEVEELGDTLKGNLDKVVYHAKRADSIVRNMLMHSREGSGEHRVVDVNSIVDESLGLAYHGARAEKKDFNVTLEKNYDPRAGSADLYPQEITRVLLNLITNGFYATEKRGVEGNGVAYEPMLSASTKNLGDAVEIRIRDNGTGIPPEVKEKMFNPFFTTKPAGEGTGLGLSLSHDIIVKQHSGTIEVETVPGAFTEFRIVLPRSGVATTKAQAEGQA